MTQITNEGLVQQAAEGALEALTALCQWFGQREAGLATSNTEAAVFARCDYASSMLEGAFGLSRDPGAPKFVVVPLGPAHKIMTENEYHKLEIKGPHVVQKDFGGEPWCTAIWYLPLPEIPQ